MRRRRAANVTPSILRSLEPLGTWPNGLSTVYSFQRRPITAIQTASRLCLRILDPQRFCRGVKVSKRMLDDVMVRRLKDDLREIVDGFPKREVVQENIDDLPADAPELRLIALLDQYRQKRESRLSTETRRIQSASGLLLSGLQQRLFSSIEAFSRTLRVHRKTVLKQWETTQSAAKAPQATSTAKLSFRVQSVGPDDERALFSEQELTVEEEAEIAAVSEATMGQFNAGPAQTLFAQEQELLAQMTELAESSRALPDARMRKLIAWLKENMCPDLGNSNAKWNDLRVIIFTEWDDTKKRYLFQQLECCHRRLRPRRRANRDLSWSYTARRARRNQSRLQRPTFETPGPNTHRHRCGPRGSESTSALLEHVPLRRSMESQPNGAAQRSH